MNAREFYTSIINYLDGQDMDAEAVKTYAVDALAKMDARNEKAKSRERKPNAEVIARRETLQNFFLANAGAEFTADQIAAVTGLTPAQISASVGKLEYTIDKGVRKIDSKHSKVTYTLSVCQ
jgi:Fic family protein